MPAKFDPKIHHRRSIRLSGYDYSQSGAYFVTVVTWQRDCLFWDVVNGEMVLNDFGKIADECWRAIPEHFPNVELGAHIIMPNHGHGILAIRADVLRSDVGAQQCCAPTTPDANENPHKINVKPRSLGAIVRSFKSAVSYRINKEHNATSIWQRNYYERIIRNEQEMDAIWRYIEANPVNWGDDEENPKKLKVD
jgi:REP element-mobilizing transposase RayT